MSPRGSGYRRLPGWRQGILSGASLWLGEDHILSIQSWRFREEYRRFSLGEIQSITVTRARSFAVTAWQVWSLLALLAAAIALVRVVADSLWWWLAVAGAMLVYWLAASLSWSCRVTLKTAVSTVILKSLNRVRAARKFLEAIEPRIAEAQGTLPENWTSLQSSSGAPSELPEQDQSEAAARGETSSHWTLLPAGLGAVALAIAGACAFLDLRAPSTAAQTTEGIASAVAAIAGVWLLVRRLQRKSATSFAVTGMASTVMVGGLAWAKQLFPTMELLISQKKATPMLVVATTSYHLIQTMTVVLSIVAACVMALVAIWKRPGARS